MNVIVAFLSFFACLGVGLFVATKIGRGRAPLLVLFLWVIGVLCGSTARADDDQVDMAEIKRLGNHVQYVDGSIRSGADDAYVEVMGPPADDNHKWFITVIGSKGCAACARLKADLKKDEYLRALVTVHENDDNHSDPRTSWAHYTYYLHGDKSQDFRWENIKLSGYPTILVQPPLNKKYGDPATVVCQITGYDGDGKKLATNIAAAIKTYLSKQAERRRQGHQAQLAAIVAERDDSHPPQPRHSTWSQTDIGLDPPWTPAPKVEPPVGPMPAPDNVLPPVFDWPPKPKPDQQPKPDATPDAPGDIPNTPEAVIVCETNLLSAADQERIRPVIERLRRDRPGLRVRIADIRDAKNLPVKLDELPAVVVTSDGKVDEKVTARLFPLFQPADATVAPSTAAPPFPWQEVATAVATGGSIPAVIAAAIGVLVWWRQRRRALNQPVIAPNLPLEQLAPLVQPLVEQLATAIAAALKPKEPA